MQCQYTKSDGKQCGAFSVSGSKFCFSHDPASKKKHLRAVKIGGLANKSVAKVVVDPIDLSTSEGLEMLLKDTISRTRQVDANGLMDSKTAYTIGTLVGKLHELHMKSYPEDKLRIIERKEAEIKEQGMRNQQEQELIDQNPLEYYRKQQRMLDVIIKAYEREESMKNIMNEKKILKV
ncbi:MAG: hypothetical protein WC227_03900 [Patescibacteria group bacterium]|jgi:hypothetical protein